MRKLPFCLNDDVLLPLLRDPEVKPLNRPAQVARCQFRISDSVKCCPDYSIKPLDYQALEQPIKNVPLSA
jgi:hypothetical protein